MAYLRPGFVVRRIMNPVASIAGTALRVRRRRSGGTQVVPVMVLHHQGARYLVAPRGETDWVRNLRAAGEGELIRMRRHERVRATEVPPAERAPIVDAYVKKWGWAVGRQFEALPDPADHPVFRVEPAA